MAIAFDIYIYKRGSLLWTERQISENVFYPRETTVTRDPKEKEGKKRWIFRPFRAENYVLLENRNKFFANRSFAGWKLSIRIEGFVRQWMNVYRLRYRSIDHESLNIFSPSRSTFFTHFSSLFLSGDTKFIDFTPLREEAKEPKAGLTFFPHSKKGPIDSRDFQWNKKASAKLSSLVKSRKLFPLFSTQFVRVE